jgi:ABC-type glutathione transport system ATPase component
VPTAEDPEPPVRLLVPRGQPGLPRGQGAHRRTRHRPRRPRGRRQLMAGTGKAHLRDDADVLLRVEDLVVEFPVGRTGLKVNAVSGISFDVLQGRDARARRRVGLRQEHDRKSDHAAPPPDERLGRVRGHRAHPLSGDPMREARTRMQMIFQDPISSLNPRRKVRQIVGAAHHLEARHRGRALDEGRRILERWASIRCAPVRASRTSSPAASASASRSPGRSCSTRRSSSATSPSARST